MDQYDTWIQSAGELHAAGKLGPAEALYRRALAAEPKRVEALCGLGVLLAQTGRDHEALAHLPPDIVFRSGSTLLLVALGGAQLATGDAAGCVASMKRALEIDAACPEAHNTLGAALLAQGKILDAVLALRAALQYRPAFPEAFYNLGKTLQAGDMPAEALAAYASALKYRPAYPQALLNRGFTLRDLGQIDEACASFRRALTFRPGYAEAMHNLGVTLAQQGQAATGIAWLRRAVETDPTNPLAHSALVYLMEFDPASTPESLTAEAARWNQRHGEPLAKNAGEHRAFANTRQPHRKLRLGYVSPDFRAHAECRFMLPLLAHHDSTQFEVHCYSSVRKPDAITHQMQMLAHVWHDVKDIPDANLARRIEEDGIDILIDLTMHMENHRLGVFARRAAPLQISWLAYPGLTGLATIDYHLSDRHLHPPGMGDDRPAEKPLRLPDSWFCYQPAPDMPAVSSLPALSAGTVTFGSLNTFRKISPEVLALWARLLNAVQAAGTPCRLLLISPPGSHRQALLDYLEQRGIPPARVELLSPMPFADYLATTHRVDIALDPFPHAGATTTLDTLCMGVPVLSLAGATPAGRLGTSILTTADLPDWLARTPDDYLAKAVQFAADLPRLANLRASLREKLARSPLLDAPRFTRHFEHTLRQAWLTWCAE